MIDGWPLTSPIVTCCDSNFFLLYSSTPSSSMRISNVKYVDILRKHLYIISAKSFDLSVEEL